MKKIALFALAAIFALNLQAVILTEDTEAVTLPGEPQNTPSAPSLASSCDSGDMDACVELALTYKDANGATQDLPAAAQLLKKACDAGNATGCAHLGELYASVDNHSAAAQLYQRGCEGGSARACYNAAAYAYKGEGVQRNENLAKEYLKRSCDLGFTTACQTLEKLAK